jgi:osmoprotectant transport system substrate-binding protein
VMLKRPASDHFPPWIDMKKNRHSEQSEESPQSWLPYTLLRFFLLLVVRMTAHTGAKFDLRAARRKQRVFLFLLCCCMTSCGPPHPNHPVIGAKNFTEQVVLGELLAQQIEAKGLKVDRRFYLAGSYICNQALISGRIDAYVEYTGTALTAILKQPVNRDPEAVLNTVRNLYQQRHHITVMDPLGFENTFAMIIRGDDAARLHLTTLSEAAQYTPQWVLGVGYEFEQRPDGLPGLSKEYGLRFKEAPVTMDLGLLYRAIDSHQVDMIAGNSTDGPIAVLGLKVLADDKHYFPPYQAVPLVRDAALKRWPVMGTAINELQGKVTADDMRAMNEAVDGQHRDPAVVVREFRLRKGL